MRMRGTRRKAAHTTRNRPSGHAEVRKDRLCAAAV